MAGIPARRRFREDVQAEVIRRVSRRDNGQCTRISRNEIEDIGERAGMVRQEAAQAFIDLAGDVWAGWVLPESGSERYVMAPTKGLPHWFAVVFNIRWFQYRGKILKPPPPGR